MNLKKYLKFITIIFFFSCAKKDFNSDFNSSNKYNLIVNIGGISEPNKESKTALINNSNHNNVLGNLSEAIQLENFTNGDISGSFFVTHNQNISNDFLNPNFKSKVAANELMTEGNRYRFIVMNSDDQIIINKEGISGQSLSIQLDRNDGEQYTYIAYSYNDDQSVPNPTNIASPTNMTIPILINKETLYASDTFVIPMSTSGNNTFNLNLIFRHQSARLDFVFDATSYPAQFTQLNASLKQTQSVLEGVLRLFDGSSSIRQGQNSTTPLSMSVRMVSESPSVRRATYYTSNFTAQNYDVLIDNVSVRLANNTIKSNTSIIEQPFRLTALKGTTTTLLTKFSPLPPTDYNFNCTGGFSSNHGTTTGRIPLEPERPISSFYNFQVTLTNVTPGQSYNITTNTVDGVRFSASGTFALNGGTTQTIRLNPTGQFSTIGDKVFTISFDNIAQSTCNVTINVVPRRIQLSCGQLVNELPQPVSAQTNIRNIFVVRLPITGGEPGRNFYAVVTGSNVQLLYRGTFDSNGNASARLVYDSGSEYILGPGSLSPTVTREFSVNVAYEGETSANFVSHQRCNFNVVVTQ